ncbi:MAG: hypothetical protein NC123_01760 [Butyrivibrio sp.]|nr:hypothetical protein [Acetatifactor muris]MCM1558265.1 hypothetical protein [Butyrivibrio sp.]
MNDLQELIKKAYKKLKCSVYFDKTQLLLRQQIVEFEKGDIEAKLQDICRDLEDSGRWEQRQKEILDSVSFRVFPKSIAEPGKTKKDSPNSGDSGNDVTLITNRVPEEIQIKDLQYFIDMSVEGHILGVLWLLVIGWRLDKDLYENSFGNRLRKLIIQELEQEDGKLSYSPYLFEPYFQQYESWRDSALEMAQNSINKNQDVIVFTMDLKRFFYSVDLNEEAFAEIWKEAVEQEICGGDETQFARRLMAGNDVIQIAQRLNLFVQAVITRYSERCHIPDTGNILPIGFLPSNVLGNWCLKKFDKAVSDGWNPLYFGRYVDDIIIVDKVEKNSALYDMMNEPEVDTVEVLRYCLAQCGRWSGPVQEECRKYALFEGESGVYTLNPIYNITEHSKSSICLQNEKVKMFYFKHGESSALLQCFRKQIAENASEFRFLPEDEAVFDADDYSEIYDIDNKESINKFRGIDGVSVNKFALSKMLGKYMRVSSLINDRVENRFARDITKIYTAHVIIDNYITWEKVIEIFVVNAQWKALGAFMENVFQAINRIKYEGGTKTEEDLQESQQENYQGNLQENLAEYLYAAWVRALSLVWGPDVKKHIKAVVKRFEDSMSRRAQINMEADMEAAILRNRRGYLLTRMYDKYIVPVLPDVLGEEWAEDASDEKEMCLCSFYAVLHEVAQKKSDEENPDENESYLFFPYMITMYDLYIRNLVFRLQEGNDTKGNDTKGNDTKGDGTKEEGEGSSLYDINTIKENYVKLNFGIDSAAVDNAVYAGSGDINGNKGVSVISVGTEQKGKLDIAVANIKLEGSNFECLVKGRPNRSYRRYKDISKIVNGAIAEKADMLVLPEACVPIEWLPVVIRTCTKNNMALITGVEHIIFKERVYNYTAVVLPYEEAGYKCAVLSFHLKNHYAPYEADLIRGYRLQEMSGKGYELYHWKDCWFPVYCCYELASIGDRALFSAYADVMVAVEWNKDVNYYSNILESLSRDLHCYCVQVNSSDYGDSRITMPSKTEEKDIIKTKGGNNAAVLVGTVDIGKLRDFQFKEYNLQKMNKEFKPTPPVFDRGIVGKKIQGKLKDALIHQ